VEKPDLKSETKPGDRFDIVSTSEAGEQKKHATRTLYWSLALYSWSRRVSWCLAADTEEIGTALWARVADDSESRLHFYLALKWK